MMKQHGNTCNQLNDLQLFVKRAIHHYNLTLSFLPFE